MSYLSQLILAFVVGLVTMPLLLPSGILMTKTKAESLDEAENKFTDRIRYIIGLILLIVLVILTNLFINIFAASFGSALSDVWINCFLFSFLEDFLLLQNTKCLFIMCCTSKNAISCLLKSCIGGSQHEQ